MRTKNFNRKKIKLLTSPNPLMSVVESYLIEYGYIFPSNEIYGRLQNLWDYGHLGVLLKENIKKAWINYFVLSAEKTYLMDGSIFTGQSVWEASGHLKNFHDVLIDCKKCKKRYREDKLLSKMCPSCKSTEFTDPKPFNLMFGVNQYILRPETAQTIFINFKNILNSYGAKVPFSVAQVGKAFRNEITIENNIFRTREFEQMELEHFSFPDEAEKDFENILEKMKTFLIEVIRLKKDSISVKEISPEERAHYSKKSVDILYKFENNWQELWGLANRGNFDLTSHQNLSKASLHYFDTQNNVKIIPFVVEHSIGLNRLMLAIITDALTFENDRKILKINPNLAPYKFAVLPLTNNEISLATLLLNKLKSTNIFVVMDSKGSIGKRYRKQDAIGTPICITIDKTSIDEPKDSFTVTIRDRDTMKQVRINNNDLLKGDAQQLFNN